MYVATAIGRAYFDRPKQPPRPPVVRCMTCAARAAGEWSQTQAHEAAVRLVMEEKLKARGWL